MVYEKWEKGGNASAKKRVQIDKIDISRVQGKLELVKQESKSLCRRESFLFLNSFGFCDARNDAFSYFTFGNVVFPSVLGVNPKRKIFNFGIFRGQNVVNKNLSVIFRVCYENFRRASLKSVQSTLSHLQRPLNEGNPSAIMALSCQNQIFMARSYT